MTKYSNGEMRAVPGLLVHNTNPPAFSWWLLIYVEKLEFNINC